MEKLTYRKTLELSLDLKVADNPLDAKKIDTMVKNALSNWKISIENAKRKLNDATDALNELFTKPNLNPDAVLAAQQGVEDADYTLKFLQDQLSILFKGEE